MRTLLLAVLTSLSFALAAPHAAAQQPAKLAYTNVEYLASLWPPFKRAETDLSTYQKQLQTELQGKEKAYMEKLQAYEAGKNTMSQLTRLDKEAELENLGNQIQLYEKNAQIELLNKQQEILTPLFDSLFVAIETVADKKGYDYVINQGSDLQTIIILYARREEDNITKDVLKYLGITPPADLTSGK